MAQLETTGGVTLAKTCATAGCSTLVAPGQRFCPRDEQRERGRRNRRVSEYGYSSAHWQRVRLARLTAARGQCELQLPGCTQTATHVHLAPAMRGQHQHARIEHCQACCANCSGAIDAPRASVGRGA